MRCCCCKVLFWLIWLSVCRGGVVLLYVWCSVVNVNGCMGVWVCVVLFCVMLWFMILIVWCCVNLVICCWFYGVLKLMIYCFIFVWVVLWDCWKLWFVGMVMRWLMFGVLGRLLVLGWVWGRLCFVDCCCFMLMLCW